MKFSIALPTDRIDAVEQFVTGPAVQEIAAGAEAMGYDAAYVTDHPAPDARWLAAGGHHALDPFVALSFAAAATTHLRLQTHILVLAYRNPFLAAKSVLSLDALSGGRVLLGVASGYLRPEFAALGVDFAERNDLLDEGIDVLRRALAEEVVEAEGRHFHARGVTMRPQPTNPRRPPIWIGGNSTAAVVRAATRGDGWVPFPNPPAAARAVRTPQLATLDDLAARLARLHEERAARGRAGEPFDVCFAPFSVDPAAVGAPAHDLGAVRAEVRALADLGVTWCCVPLPPVATRQEYLAAAERFAAEVVHHPDISLRSG